MAAGMTWTGLPDEGLGGAARPEGACVAFRDGRQVRLLSRNRLPLNNTYRELVDALATQDTTRLPSTVDGLALN